MYRKLIISSITSFISYLLFFYPLLNPDTVVLSGNDNIRKHYPLRIYLYEKLKDGKFPFWTEKIFSGFPVYASLENGYLNPINILLLMAFGPITSYKMLHFGTYFLGSIGLYLLLKKHSGSIFGYVVANFIYFFGFFNLYHLEHITIIMASNLLPLTLYLLDKYFESGMHVFFFLFSLIFLFLFYFGSFQMLVILALSNLLYFIFGEYYKKKFRTNLLFIVIISVSVILPLTLPGFLPNLELVQNSRRVSVTDFREGSFTPATLANLVIPFLFKMEKNYNVPTFFEPTPIQETYVYVGIVAFISSTYYLMTDKNSKIKKFIFTLFIVSLFLCILGNLPFAERVTPPFIKIFRYWGRASVLTLFSIAFSVGLLLSSQSKNKLLHRQNLLVYTVLTITLISIQFLTVPLQINKDIKYFFTNTVFDMSVGYRAVWVYLLLGALIIVLLHFFFPKKRKLLILFLCALVITDTFYFTKKSLQYDTFIKTENLPNNDRCLSQINNPRYNNMRILDLTGCINDTNAMFVNSWTLFGTSQFISQNYIDLVKRAGLERMRGVKLSKEFDIRDRATQTYLSDLGINYIILNEHNDIELSNSVYKNIHPVSHYQEEGRIISKIAVETPQLIETSIIYYPGWELTVNGSKHDIIKATNGVHVSFYSESGINQVELKYKPISFINGTITSIIWLVFGIPVYFLFKKRILKHGYS